MLCKSGMKLDCYTHRFGSKATEEETHKEDVHAIVPGFPEGFCVLFCFYFPHHKE